MQARQPLGGRAGALGERGVDGGRPRPAAGAALAGRSLRGADGHPVAGDAPRESQARLVVRHGEDRTGMTLGQLAPGEHPEHLLRQLEEPQPVRDAGLRAADVLGDLAERKLELVDERRIGARLFDGREVLPRDVLDERQEERLAVVHVTHE